MRRQRRTQTAEELAELASAERLLEHPIGARLLEASDGDATHALRVLDELERSKVRAGDELAEVIRLPRDPILNIADVYDRELDDEEEVDVPRLSVGAAFWVAVVLGLAGWLVLAALGFGLYELVEWLR